MKLKPQTCVTRGKINRGRANTEEAQSFTAATVRSGAAAVAAAGGRRWHPAAGAAAAAGD